MAKNSPKKICFVCEGEEEFDYINQLKECKVWNSIYNIKVKKAKSIDSISAIYDYTFKNDNYDLIVIFCDTELEPYEQFKNLRNKIKQNHEKDITNDVIYFANPCTMQVILSHFDKVHLTNNSKVANSKLIQKYTGVSDYRANEKQRNSIMKKITKENYETMKQNLKEISTNYNDVPSTNLLILLNNLESSDTLWVDKITKKY